MDIKKGIEINQFFEYVTGTFNTKDTHMICVSKNKYKEVELCIKSDKDKGCNIPVAQIKLYSRDSFGEASKAYEDAKKLCEEIVRRWNKEIE